MIRSCSLWARLATLRTGMFRFRRVLVGLAVGVALLLAYSATGPFYAEFREWTREKAKFWGMGSCEPFDMPRNTTAVYPPHENLLIHWQGEDAFWRMFPCARSAYRVILPTEEDMRSAAPPPTCNATIATAWFDIGRSKWKTYRRSNEEYFQNLATVMAMTNRMAIYTSPDLVDMIVSARRKHGLMDRTVVVGMQLFCTPSAHLHDYTRKRMCETEYLRGAVHPEVPERNHPWYNLIMWAKAYFFYATSMIPRLSGDYYIWLDAGCHPPMCGPHMAGSCLAPAKHARYDRVRIAQVEPLEIELLSKDPMAFLKDKHVHFAGTIFGTGAGSVKMLFDLFLDTLHYMLTLGAVDQDQSVFAYMYFKQPFTFDSYDAPNRWEDVVRLF